MLCITPPPLHFSVLHKNPKFIPTRTTHNQPSTTPFTVRSSSSVKEIENPAVREGELSSSLWDSAPFPPIRAAKRVVLVRHGQSTWNEEGRIQGSSDFSVLTAKGESQAETSRLMLIDDAFDVCFSRSGFWCSISLGVEYQFSLVWFDLFQFSSGKYWNLVLHVGRHTHEHMTHISKPEGLTRWSIN